MIEKLIAAAALVTAFFVGVLTIQTSEEIDSSYPLDTDVSFSLTSVDSLATKAELIDGLNELASSTGTTIFKIATNPGDPHNGRDLVWFGIEPDHGTSSPIWFDPSTPGTLIPSSDVGDRPLDGYFTMYDSPNTGDELGQWARDNSVRIDGLNVKDVSGVTTTLIANTGSGISIVAMLLLCLTLVMSWLATTSRSRVIRMQAGQRPVALHAWDVWRMMRAFLAGALAGWLLMTGYTAFRFGFGQVASFMSRSFPVLLTTLVLITLVTMAMSWGTRPSVAQAASREVPLQSFSAIGVTVRLVAVTLSLMVLPFALSYTDHARHAQQEASRWAAAEGTVRVSVSAQTLEAGHAEEYENRLSALLRQSDASGNLALSFSLDQVVQLSAQEMRPYDHIIVTNPRFLTLFSNEGGQGSDRASPITDELVPLSIQEISPGVMNSLEENMNMWSTPGADALATAHLYTTSPGSPSFPAIGDQRDASNPVQADHPLVVVIDKPSDVFTSEGVLDAFVANGQIVFTDADELRRAMSEFGLDTYFTSIDNVADQILDSAHLFAQQARLGVIAIALASGTLIVALIQSARIWAEQHHREIFARRSSGHTYVRITSRRVVLEALLLILAAGLAGGASIAVFHVQPVATALMVAALLAIYIAATHACHQEAARHSFRKSVLREQ